MAELFTIKVYQSDGTTLDTSVYGDGIVDDAFDVSCKNARIRGCLNGKFSTARASSVEDSFKIAKDQVIKIYDGSDNEVFVGYVESSKKSVEDNNHQYNLRGLYDRLRDVRITTAIRLGSLTSNSGTASTVGEIVQYVIDTYAPSEIIYDAALIDCDIVVKDKLIPVDQPIDELLSELEKFAMSGGAAFAYGVRQDSKFFFHAISTAVGDRIDTMTAGTDVFQATETPADMKPVNQIHLIGEPARASTGIYYRTNRFYAHSSVSTNHGSRPRYYRMVGIRDEDDFRTARDGIFFQKAQPGYRVSGSGKIPLSAYAAAPLPWNGQISYEDIDRGAVVTAYVNSIELRFDDGLEISPTLGIDDASQRRDRVADKFTDRALDRVDPPDSEIREQGQFTTGVNGSEEINTGYPGTVSTDPPDGYGDGGGGTDIFLPAGEVLNASILPKNPIVDTAGSTADIVKALALVSNGDDGTFFDAFGTDAVKVFFAFEDADEELTFPPGISLEKISTDDHIETWVLTGTGYQLPTEAGTLYAAIRVKTSDSPATYNWYPADIADASTAPERLLRANVIDLAQAGAGSGGSGNAITVILGWGV